VARSGWRRSRSPRERYDELRLGDSVAVHYPPFFPYIARAADRTTLQALGDATSRLFADPFFARFLLWLVAGIMGLWLASRIATLAIPVAGAAWIVAGFMFLFPAANPPAGGATSGMARVQGVTLLAAIDHERRVELAMEGDRWSDLVRTGMATTVLGIPEFQTLWPIPQTERAVAPGLTQNPGY
jgi:hypothetical protein